MKRLSLFKKPHVWAFFLFLSISLNVLAYLFHFYVMLRNAVDLPFFDEWEVPFFLAKPISWKALLTAHNEHRLPLTKLFIWILYRMDSWNVVHNQVLNFIVYGALAFVIGKIVWKATAKKFLPIVVLSLLPLFSLTNFETHAFAFNIHFHLFVLFFLLAVLFRYPGKSPSTPLLVLSGLFSFLSVCAFSGGIFCCLALFLGDIIFFHAKNLRKVWLVNIPIVMTILFWIFFYNRPVGEPALTLPWARDFWVYLFKMAANSFGLRSDESWYGIVFFVLLAIPFASALLAKPREIKTETKALLVAVAGLAFTAAANAMGRAGLGIVSAGSPRYSQVFLIMFPLIVTLQLGEIPIGENGRSS